MKTNCPQSLMPLSILERAHGALTHATSVLLFHFWLFGVFAAVCGLSLAVVMGAPLWLRCTGSSLRWHPVVGHTLGVRRLSSCSSRDLEHGLGSCCAPTQLLLGTWDLPPSGIEPMSPALAGGFFTTEPPGKPYSVFLKRHSFNPHDGLMKQGVLLFPSHRCEHRRRGRRPRGNTGPEENTGP